MICSETDPSEGQEEEDDEEEAWTFDEQRYSEA